MNILGSLTYMTYTDDDYSICELENYVLANIPIIAMTVFVLDKDKIWIKMNRRK